MKIWPRDKAHTSPSAQMPVLAHHPLTHAAPSERPYNKINFSFSFSLLNIVPTLHFLSKGFKNVHRRNRVQDLMAKSVIKNSLVWFVCPANFHVEAIGFTISVKQSIVQGWGWCLGKSLLLWALREHYHQDSSHSSGRLRPAELLLIEYPEAHIWCKDCHVKIWVERASLQLLKFSIVDLQCEYKQEHHL